MPGICELSVADSARTVRVTIATSSAAFARALRDYGQNVCLADGPRGCPSSCHLGLGMSRLSAKTGAVHCETASHISSDNLSERIPVCQGSRRDIGTRASLE